MSTNISRIMLVDDNPDDIFFHTRTIRKTHPGIEIIPMVDAAEALEYLKKAVHGEKPAVDLIFLDINMPGMSGWDFLDAYGEIGAEVSARRVIVILTTSSREEEKERALSYRSLIDFKTKPLTKEMLEDILTRLP